jgi:hypothetical protein
MATLGDEESEIQHQSIEALLAAYPGESDPQELIRKLARKKVAYAKQAGWTGPPYCPKELASIFGIRCKEVDHEIDGDGRILLCPNGKLRIEYRSKRLFERQRFTIFHEFAHTLFPDYCDFLPLHQSSPKNKHDPERAFENLCDVAATEMLFPFDDFYGDLKKLERIKFSAIHDLRGRYQASIDATIHRLIEVEDTVGCAAVFLTDQKGKFSEPGPLWVKYCKVSSQFRGFIWPGTPPPANSIAFHCYQNDTTTDEFVRETWTSRGKSRTWAVQAAKLPLILESPDYSKVVMLLFPPD